MKYSAVNLLLLLIPARFVFCFFVTVPHFIIFFILYTEQNMFPLKLFSPPINVVAFSTRYEPLLTFLVCETLQPNGCIIP